MAKKKNIKQANIGTPKKAIYRRHYLKKELNSLNQSIHSFRQLGSRKFYKPTFKKGISLDERLNQEKKKIENIGLRQDIELKKTTLFCLFGFLFIETFIIFIFSFWQATGGLGFMLEEWSFKLLITSTIIQITYMLQVAVRHLFPN